MRRYRDAKDGGAMAIVLAVVMTVFAVPVAGFAVTQLVRNGLQGELQRAADQGSLAGSAVIPLADAGTLKTYVASTPSGVNSTAGLIPASYCTKGPAELGSAVTSTAAGGTCPKDIACFTALTSLQKDTAFAKNYAIPYGSPSCTAAYSDDLSFFSRLDSCVNATSASLLNLLSIPSLDTLLSPILNTLGGLTTGLVPMTPLGLGSLLPALLEPGVTVSMSFSERGPLDSLTPGDNGATHTMTRYSTAKRAFKNVVVVPTVGVPGTVSGTVALTLSLLGIPTPKNSPTVGPGTYVDLNPTLAASMSTVRSTLSSLDTLVGSQLPACAGLVGSLSGDLSDLLDPPTSGAPTAAQVLADAGASASPVLALSIPTNLTTGTQIPFLDFVPVCLAQAGGVPDTTKAVVENIASGTPATLPSGISSVGSCTTAAPGAFRGRLVS